MKILTRSAVSVTGPYDVHPHLAQDRKPPQHPMTLHFLQAGCYSQCPTSSVKVLQTILMPTNTHTHTRSTALFPGKPGSANIRNVKPIWILLKQETVSGSCISWQICTSLQTDNHTSTPPLCFLQAGCPSCRPTNSVRAPVSYTHLTLPTTPYV